MARKVHRKLRGDGMSEWKTETKMHDYAFNDVLTIVNGKNQKAVENKNGVYPIYGSGGIMGYADDFLCPENTVVIGRKGSINKPLFVETKFWNVDTAFGLVAKSEILQPKYLYYFCERYDFEQLNKTVTIPSLTKADLLKIKIPLPPLDEQKQIAAVLDKCTAIIAKRKQQLSALDDLIKARFVEMFGDPETNPKKWKKSQLNEHAEVIVGYPFPSDGYTTDGIDIIGGYNIMHGFIQWENSKYWSNAQGYEQYLLKPNDIVMAMDRPWVNGGFKIAKIDAIHLPALLIQRTACIRGIDIKQELLYSLLNSQRFAEHCNITGSLVPHISNKDINSFQIIFPPMEEQNQFADFVSRVDKTKAKIQKYLEKSQLLFDSLMQEYFG